MSTMTRKQLREMNSGTQKSGMITKTSGWGLVADVVIWILLLGVAFCCIIPLWHVLMASISDGKELLSHEGVLFTPAGNPTLEGYRYLFRDASILQGYGNTLIYVVGATFLGFILNVLGGYALSHQSKLRSAMTLFVMFTMMFNGGLIPTYIVIKSLGMVGTRWALLIPGCTMALFVLMMSNAFQSVPQATIEAAELDGAGHFRTMIQIALPQTGNILVVTILNSVILQWNSWFNASIYVTNARELWPLQLWIRQIVADNENILRSSNPDYNRYLVQYGVIIAATLPVLVAFPFFQKRLEAGAMAGAVKG